LVAILRGFCNQDRDEWWRYCSKKTDGLPCLNIDEIKDDSQARINNYVVNFKDRFLGDVKILAIPYTLVQSGRNSKLRTNIGEHTDLVMHEIGYTDQESKTEKGRGD